MISFRIINFNTFKNVCSQKDLQNMYNHHFISLKLSECECKCHSSNWHYHGYYLRTVIIFGVPFVIKVARIKCKECGATHSLLPYFIIPYLQYSSFDLSLFDISHIESFVKTRKRKYVFIIFVDST